MLIALVVLLIGIYAMMAIFPRGYSAIIASEMRTTASQLAESELARWKLSPESLPDAIIATDYDGNPIPGTLVGTPSALSSLPSELLNSVSSMLLVWDQGAIPLPGNYNYRGALIDGSVFLRLDRIPGARYDPEDLTPCQYDGVSAMAESSQPRRDAWLHPNWEPNSLYLPRTVIGERINIRRLSSQAAGVPFYLLSHAPLDPEGLRHQMAPGDDPSTPQIETQYPKQVDLDVYDAKAWEYVAWSIPRPALGPRQFTYDPSGKRLYFAVSTALTRVFKVDYTARREDGTLTRIHGYMVSANPEGLGLQPLPWPASDPATIRVFEGLVPLGAKPADLTTWPRNAYYVGWESAITGKIEFCPLVQTDPQPDDIALAKVDYRLADWQILVFDVEAPPDGVVRLPITNLKGSSFVNYPRQPRPQIVAKGVRDLYDADGTLRLEAKTHPDDARTWAWVVVVDRQNGDILTDSQATTAFGLPINPYERRTQLQVDFRNGVIYFNYNPDRVEGYRADVDTPDRSGRTYRIFCRGEADWAVQLLPAARVYARSSTRYPAGYPVGLREPGAISTMLLYSWLPQTRQLYFPLSEQGQAVAVDYYTDTGRYIEGEVHTIGKPSVTELRVWVCPLSEQLQNATNQFGPVNVRGVSVRARAVWVNRGRQSSLADIAKRVNEGYTLAPEKSLEETWRQVIVTTFITRTPI